MARSKSTRKGKAKRPKTGSKKKKGVTKKHSQSALAQAKAVAIGVEAMDTDEGPKSAPKAAGLRVKPAVKIGKPKGKATGKKAGKKAVGGATMQE
mmetsp:Transcript_9510/g.24216  ORF Transcript_9510/g.24216 Transcript_9510/m.24216 type:complete len:95 (+) Transcript_9510:179-463(+)